MSGTTFFNTQENPQEKRSMEQQDSRVQRNTSFFGATEKRTTENTANVLLLDVSSSTSDKIGRGDNRTKLSGIIEAATAYISGLPHSALLGLIAFGSKAYELSRLAQVGNNKINLINPVQLLTSRGSTDMAGALSLASNMLGKVVNSGMLLRVHVLTDGIPDCSPKMEAEQLKRMGVQLHTIGFGDGSYIDEHLLREIASPSQNGGSLYYHFLDSRNLSVFMKQQSKIYTS